VWVGLFVLVGLAGTVVTLAVLTDAALFRGRYVISTGVPSAGGIRKGDPVQMRGVNIGRIVGFRIGQQAVDVRLEIEGEYPIPSDSRVELRSGGLLGGMVADVVPGASTESATWGDRLPGSIGAGVLDRMDDLAAQADRIAVRVQTLLSDGMVDDLHAGAGEGRLALQELSGLLREQRGEVRDLVASLKRSAAGLEQAAAGPELERTVKRVDELAQRLDGTLASVDRASRSLESILGRIDRGEGTLGKLSHDEALYRNLTEASAGVALAAREMQALAVDLKEHPGRYVHLSLF
jgi:phospholipid/cholesterol/gamma-HCH transport system substrate-binding protein